MKTGKVEYLIAIGLAIWISLGMVGAAGTLTSIQVTTAPVIDGTPESLWDQATAMTLNVAGGANEGSHTVTLKCVPGVGSLTIAP